MNSRRDFLQKLTASAFVLPLIKRDLSSAIITEPYQGPVLKVKPLWDWAVMAIG